MQLGYYKYIIKAFLINSFRNYQLRRDNLIGRNCQINKRAQLKGNVQIRDAANIGQNVILNKNVIVGSNTRLSEIEIGINTQIEGGVVCTGYGKGKIKIGKECYIGHYNILDWSDNITIGDYVHIAGPSTGLWTHSSAKMCLNGDLLNNKTSENRPTAPIIIEDNVYIGGNCTVYPGVTIHHHSIIAPNSAVTKDVPPNMLCGGVPGKVIKKLKFKI